MPSNFTQVRIRGLSTYNSDFSEDSPQFLQDCNNIVINRENIAEPRRGMKIYGNQMGVSPTTDIAHQLMTYKRRLLRHYGAGPGTTLEFDNGSGVFSAFSGTYSEVDEGLRIKSVEVNGNFYFTTADGIKKISAASASDLTTGAGYITNAGGVKALDLDGDVDYSQTGFLTQDSVVGYRIVWGIKDANGNLIIGFPSSRLVIRNPIGPLLIIDFNRLLSSLDTAAAVNTGTLKDTNYLATYKMATDDNALVIYNALVGLSNKLDADMGGTTYSTIAAGHVAPDASPTSAQLDDLQVFYNEIVDALLSESLAHIDATAQAAGNFQNSTQSAIVSLTSTIPQAVNSDAYFYQIYRTAVSQSSGVGFLDDLDPGDEMGLVFEANTTAAERSVGIIGYTDIVPESFRGANLYTNPQSGEGILQANEIPPVAKDIALFKNSVFYANTRTKHRRSLSLLGVTNFTSGVSSITVIQGTSSNKYTFVSPLQQTTDINFVSGASYQSSGSSDYFDIYAGQDTKHYRVWFQRGTSVAPSSGGATLVMITITGAETATQAAVKGYNALNVFNDFILTLPVSAILTATTVVPGVTTNSSENVVNPGFTVVTSQEGAGEDATQNFVLLSNAPTPAQQVDETARSLVRVINRNSSEFIYAFYLSGPSDVPGLMQLESRLLNTEPFYIIANNASTGDSFTPIISPTNTITANTIANPTVVSSAAHGLVNGDQIIIANSNSTPSINGLRTVTVLSPSTFSVPVNVTIAGTTGVWRLASTAVVSDNEISPNRIYFSKTQQPEAVPIVNYFDVGPKDKVIQRIVPLRDSLFVLKEDAIYRISGDSSSSGFAQALFDSSAFIAAADSAAVLNNQIFMFSNQGIVVVTDTGVSIISIPIEDLVLPLVLGSNFATATFGVSYESDRSYMLFTITDNNEEIATQCFRYNTNTEAWTKWEETKNCGIVLTEHLYFGAGDTNYTEIERKSFNRTDYADRELSKTIGSGAVNGTTISIGDVSDVSIHDVFFQEQYLTIYKYNQLLTKLDMDNNATFNDYLSTVGASSGSDLRDLLDQLAAKLDTDTGINDTTFSSSISAFTSSFPDTQEAYNTIVGILNNSGAAFHNYAESEDTVIFEAIILEKNVDSNSIVIAYELPIIQGASLVFEHIPTRIVFNPQFFGDSELFKQVSETKFIFDRTNFTEATVSYSTDLSPSFEEYTFDKQGNGAFGTQIFGDSNFGGNADKTPFRTLVPRNKQRCRFLVPKIEHGIAREKMATVGYSMYFSSDSPRPYQR